MKKKKELSIIKAKECLLKAFLEHSFLDACSDVANCCGISSVAEALSELHNLCQIDVIDGFLLIEKDRSDFWSIDSLMYYTIKKCTKLDVVKTITLCSKVKELEGSDLAAGRLFDVYEAYLAKNIADAKRAFEFATQIGNSHDALPCITRAYSTFDNFTPTRKLIEFVDSDKDDELLLASVFSLQFSVCEDATIRDSVRRCIKRFVKEPCGDILKRAVYMTSRAWGFEDYRHILMTQGIPAVLCVVVTEFSNENKELSEYEFRSKLWCFLNFDIKETFLLERLDYVLKSQYERFPNVVLGFLREYTASVAVRNSGNEKNKELFPSLLRYFSKNLSDTALIKVLVDLLISDRFTDQFLAYSIASRIDSSRTIVCENIDIDVAKLAYLFRKTLGWIYGRKQICLPMLFGCIAKMSSVQLKEIEELFYDPICLNFCSDIESNLGNWLQGCDKEVTSFVEGHIKRAKEFYGIFREHGPCNELHPSAEMRTIALKRQQSLMRAAQVKSMKNSIIGMLSDNAISLLHGGKMISYVKREKGEFSRQISPMNSHSISLPIPKLMVANGVHTEKVLRCLRMESYNDAACS